MLTEFKLQSLESRQKPWSIMLLFKPICEYIMCSTLPVIYDFIYHAWTVDRYLTSFQIEQYRIDYLFYSPLNTTFRNSVSLTVGIFNDCCALWNNVLQIKITKLCFLMFLALCLDVGIILDHLVFCSAGWTDKQCSVGFVLCIFAQILHIDLLIRSVQLWLKIEIVLNLTSMNC